MKRFHRNLIISGITQLILLVVVNVWFPNYYDPIPLLNSGYLIVIFALLHNIIDKMEKEDKDE